MIENQPPTPSPEEISLLARLRLSEDSALGVIFQKYYRYLCVTAFQFLGETEKSKDMAQDVFFEIWKRREELDVRSSLKSYLRRACVNKCLNYLKAQRLDFSEPETSNIAQPSPEPSAQALVEGQNLSEALDRALVKLPTQCRVIFVLSRIDQLSHREIAERLDISPKTIENQITKALKILREELGAFL